MSIPHNRESPIPIPIGLQADSGATPPSRESNSCWRRAGWLAGPLTLCTSIIGVGLITQNDSPEPPWTDRSHVVIAGKTEVPTAETLNLRAENLAGSFARVILSHRNSPGFSRDDTVASAPKFTYRHGHVEASIMVPQNVAGNTTLDTKDVTAISFTVYDDNLSTVDGMSLVRAGNGWAGERLVPDPDRQGELRPQALNSNQSTPENNRELYRTLDHLELLLLQIPQS